MPAAFLAVVRVGAPEEDPDVEVHELVAGVVAYDRQLEGLPGREVPDGLAYLHRGRW